MLLSPLCLVNHMDSLNYQWSRYPMESLYLWPGYFRDSLYMSVVWVFLGCRISLALVFLGFLIFVVWVFPGFLVPFILGIPWISEIIRGLGYPLESFYLWPRVTEYPWMDLFICGLGLLGILGSLLYLWTGYSRES